MKQYLTKLVSFFFLILATTIISNAWAFEIITKEDIRQGNVVNVDLIKTADNAIILFDSSSSMNKPYKDSGISRYDIAKMTLTERNSYLPDLGYNFGLYLYTPWKAIYPIQKYDRNKFAQALDTLPKKASSGTFLTDGLRRLDSILAKLEGKTSVFIYTDGSDTNRGGGMKTPSDIAEELAKKYNVCFYFISTADDYYSDALFTKKYNFCSRVIGFDNFIANPMYNSEALFTVKATKDIITVTDKKVVGIKTKNFLFNFDKSELSQDAKDRLQILAAFLKKNPTAFAALAGHTDNTGTKKYNLGLSKRRIEAVANYLIKNLKVAKSQIVMFWFGQLNPVADNTTREGRMQNRRVEILVGGM
ncbi:MAG: OmpA family protein [Desulfobacteraceae bacterium]|nr:OmpA family protein [Desulfobacteraceae bacterium]